jgi:HD-GYP domain-containing protein (c-di-GMP phosphodiesterase class II)
MRKIRLTELRVGTAVDADIYSIDFSLLVKRGTVLNEYILENLKAKGVEWVISDAAPSEEEAEISVAEHSFLRALKRDLTRIYRELGIVPILSSETVDEAIARLSVFFDEARSGTIRAPDELDPVAARLLSEIQAAPPYSLLLYDLKNPTDYLFWHDVAVAVYLVLTLKNEPVYQDHLAEIVLGGLLHDLGIFQIPSSIVNKPFKLSMHEYEMIKEHPRVSYNILKANSNIHPDVLEMILYHHERKSGKGYPFGLSGEKVPELASYLAVCDAYAALITDRPHRRRSSIPNAISALVINADQNFGTAVITSFLKAIGLYPVGSLVRLNNGDWAVVFRSDTDQFTRPVVKVIYDTHYNAVDPAREIDLSQTEEVYVRTAVNIVPS